MTLTRPLAGVAVVAHLVIGLLALVPDCAHACSCGRGVPFRVLARGGGRVRRFSGEVLDIEEGPPARMFGTGVASFRATLRVSEVWKGHGGKPWR